VEDEPAGPIQRGIWDRDPRLIFSHRPPFLGVSPSALCPWCVVGRQNVKIFGTRTVVVCTRYPLCQYERAADYHDWAICMPLHRCPQCGCDLIVYVSPRGAMIRCARKYDCRFSSPLRYSARRKCPDCQGIVFIRSEMGKKGGRFTYACSRFPECFFETNIPLAKEKCQKCGHWAVELWTGFPPRHYATACALARRMPFMERPMKLSVPVANKTLRWSRQYCDWLVVHGDHGIPPLSEIIAHDGFEPFPELVEPYDPYEGLVDVDGDEYL